MNENRQSDKQRDEQPDSALDRQLKCEMSNALADIFNAEPSPEMMRMWANYKRASNELKGVVFEPPEVMPLPSTAQVPPHLLRNTLSGGSFDYHEFATLIEKYYAINLHDLYASWVFPKQLIKDCLQIDDKQYDIFSNKSAIDSLEAAKMMLIAKIINAKIPYADFWTHLCLYDFKGLVSGEKRVMHKEPIGEDQRINHMREIFFREAEQVVGSRSSLAFTLII